jgi:outer membrane protein OmpA-like peptidoglycan-associated protein
MKFGETSKMLARLAVVVVLASSSGACAMMPSWLGGDDDTASTTTPTDANGFPVVDQSAASTQTASTDTSGAAQPSDASQAANESGNGFPDLADTPDRPKAPSTANDQKQTSDSLAAQGDRQNYSADQLRAGTETAAAPPPDKPEPVEKTADATPSPSDTSSATSDDSSTPAATAATPAPAPTAPVIATQTAAPPMAPSGVPAVPPINDRGIPGMQAVAMNDSALGFQPSRAPPLDPSVSQFVAPPIIARYRQTASMGGSQGVGSITYVASTGPAVGPSTRSMGGPEKMSGAVVANFDSLQGQQVAAPSVYADSAGLPPQASVYFTHDTTILSSDAKAQVQATAQAFASRGSSGFVRVVGYSSSNSTKLTAARRMEWNLERSQARANAVARELIRDGVPADRVLVEGRGDQESAAYTAVPAGGDSGHRADIYIQG